MPTLPIAATISMNAVPALSFDLGTTIGALEIGILVALFLSGMATVQVILYFQRHWHDSRGLKFAVGLCWALDFGHTIAICHTLYTITVTQYGHPELLIIPPLSLDVSILMSGFIGPLQQGWFTYRLYKLTNKPVLPLFCMCLAIARFVGIIGLSTIALGTPPIPEYNRRAGWLIEAIVIVSATLDTILVSSLCYYLSSWRLDKSHVMHKIVNQIMTWTIETGSVTIIGALGLLITFLTMKDNLVYIGFFVIIPKLFSNSLLLSSVVLSGAIGNALIMLRLNARDRFAEVIRADTTGSRPPASMLELTAFPSPRPSSTVNFLGIRSGTSDDLHEDNKRPFSASTSASHFLGEGLQSGD